MMPSQGNLHWSMQTGICNKELQYMSYMRHTWQTVIYKKSNMDSKTAQKNCLFEYEIHLCHSDTVTSGENKLSIIRCSEGKIRI